MQRTIYYVSQSVDCVKVAGTACGSPATGLPYQLWPTPAASVSVPCRSLDRDRRAEGPVRHVAFDTVDHNILIRRLKTTYDVTGMVS